MNFKIEIMLNSELSNNDEKLIIERIIEYAHRIYLDTSYKGCVLYINGTGDLNDFARIGIIITCLKNQDWFTSNVKTWLLYDPDGGVEDIKKHYSI